MISTKIPASELEHQTSKILGKYPNTYTFTKSMNERIMKNRNQKDKLPITIVRPSIIGCSNRSVPYWVDTVSACGGLILFAGIGIVRTIIGNLDHVPDLIPLDYVADMIIVAADYAANKMNISVFYSATSSMNPTSFRIVRRTTSRIIQDKKGLGSQTLISLIVKDIISFSVKKSCLYVLSDSKGAR